MRVLVTGGTGTLGTAIVRQLRDRGHDPLTSSRTAGLDRVVVDFATGSGIDDAVEGVDAIVHAASDPGRQAKTTDVEGTRRLAKTGIPVLYMSIVGVDIHPFRYYRIKRQGELALAANATAWTVLRATQFHAFLDRLITMSRSAAQWIPGNGDSGDTRFPAARGLMFQPVSHEEVAGAVIDLLESGPTNQIEQFAGPQQLESAELIEAWARARGGRPFYVPTAGRIARAFKEGYVLAEPGVRTGTATWDDHLLGNG